MSVAPASSKLSLKQPAKLKPKTAEEIEAELFTNTRFGTFSMHFAVQGEPVKANKSDGYLALKPRGHDRITRHFVLVSNEPLPSVKDLLKLIEAKYGHSTDYKIAQIHCKPLPR